MGQRLTSPDDPQLQHELYRFMFSLISQAYFGLVNMSTEYPDFLPLYNQIFNIIFPNPDDAYYVAPVDGEGVYKISGYRGTVRMVNFQVARGTMITRGTGGIGNMGPTVANYDADRDLHLNGDGSFEVILSQERPKGYSGNWWHLDPNAAVIVVRQRAYDWLHEVDGRFAIERLDRPPIKPRASTSEIAENLKQISKWTEQWTRLTLDWAEKMRSRDLVNKIVLTDYSQASGLSTQMYLEGLFELRPDEALILETEVPQKSLYWNFQLTDELMSMVDPLNRQTSLNGYTANLDDDGKFRAVISLADPGIPNWLDTAGYTRGNIYGRWTECSDYPQPFVKKVKVDDIRLNLPSSTPLVTPEERETLLRLRRKGAQLRRRW